MTGNSVKRLAGSQPDTLTPCFLSSKVRLVTTGSGKEPNKTKGG